MFTGLAGFGMEEVFGTSRLRFGLNMVIAEIWINRNRTEGWHAAAQASLR